MHQTNKQSPQYALTMIAPVNPELYKKEVPPVNYKSQLGNPQCKAFVSPNA